MQFASSFAFVPGIVEINNLAISHFHLQKYQALEQHDRVCIRKENSGRKRKSMLSKELKKNFPINANFKSFKLMLLFQCYHNNITVSYSHHCKEMLSLINIFVHLKNYWSICLWFSLPHLPGAIPRTCLFVLYSILKAFQQQEFFTPPQHAV